LVFWPLSQSCIIYTALLLLWLGGHNLQSSINPYPIIVYRMPSSAFRVRSLLHNSLTGCYEAAVKQVEENNLFKMYHYFFIHGLCLYYWEDNKNGPTVMLPRIMMCSHKHTYFLFIARPSEWIKNCSSTSASLTFYMDNEGGYTKKAYSIPVILLHLQCNLPKATHVSTPSGTLYLQLIP
jgi:hypothetical protein